MKLPQRFIHPLDLPEKKRDEAYTRYHFKNVKKNDLQPLLQQKFFPLLKTHGFKKSGSLFFRDTGMHYYHFLQVRFNNNSLGRFNIVTGIAIDVIPHPYTNSFNPKTIKIDSDCLFTDCIRLPNGNFEFDNGTNLEEAHETVDFLIAAFKKYEKQYFSQFKNFPQPIDTIGVSEIKKIDKRIKTNQVTKYGTIGATIPFFAYRLALIQHYLKSDREAQNIINFITSYPGIKHSQLFLKLVKKLEKQLQNSK